MTLTDIFIRRPVVAIVVNLLIIVAGVQAIGALSVRQYPRVDSATVTVSTVYVGAEAELVRGFVTTPLERAIAGAEGIDYMESQSAEGISTIQVRLDLDFPGTTALADISTRVDRVRNQLPPEAEIPAITLESSDAQIAAMYVGFRSPILADNQLTDFLIRVVQPRLSAIDGVQRADILGERAFAIRAWLRADRMAALGITPAEVRDALAANNALAAVGHTDGALVSIPLSVSTDLRSLEEFKQLVVRNDGDTLVRLSDIATVELGAETYDSEVRFSGERAVFLGVWTLPDANNLDVIADVRDALADMEHHLPEGIEISVAFDSTVYIDDALREVLSTLLETIAIVIVVIFLFLGSVRTVLVPVTAIPLSLIGAVGLMQLFGFTINLLTLLAIVLSVGLVVDDAIVMLENIERHAREGKSPVEAARIGARELVGPVIAMTITLAAVYIPIGLQGGLTGALFREFAFTLAGTVVISGIVALTLSPVMASRVIRVQRERGWLGEHIDRGFSLVRRIYARALASTLNARKIVYVVWAALALATVPMFMFSPHELAPPEDQGVLFTSLELPANASVEQVEAYSEQVQKIFAADPDYDHSFQLSSPTRAFGGMVVRPWSERTRTIFVVQQDASGPAAAIAGVRAPMFIRPALPSPGLMPVEFVISSTAEHDKILEFAAEFIEEAATSGQFAFPPIPDVRLDQARVDIVLDRDQVTSMGLNMADVGGDLAAMLGGNFVNRFDLDGRSYKVIAQIERKGRLVPEQILDVHITGADGKLIPLSSVASLHNSVQPRTLNRFQQLNSVKLSGVAPRSVDGALQVLEKVAERTLPPGYEIDYTGESRQLRQESGKFLPALGLALLVVFLVLAAQFDSFRDPLVILLGSVPLALFGALVFTFLHFAGPPQLHFSLTSGWTTTINIYSEVGLVTLVALVSRNGILVVEFANVLQRAGHSKLEAVKEAAATRLRPVLMITVATIAGHFPLTLVTGPGAAARNSIGLVLVGGMAIGSLFTLFAIPAIYMALARDHSAQPGERLARRRKGSGSIGESP